MLLIGLSNSSTCNPFSTMRSFCRRPPIRHPHLVSKRCWVPTRAGQPWVRSMNISQSRRKRTGNTCRIYNILTSLYFRGRSSIWSRENKSPVTRSEPGNWTDMKSILGLLTIRRNCLRHRSPRRNWRPISQVKKSRPWINRCSACWGNLNNWSNMKPKCGCAKSAILIITIIRRQELKIPRMMKNLMRVNPYRRKFQSNIWCQIKK